MHTVAHIAEFLDKFAPPALAESWDNVGLLVGRSEQPVERVMTCLTITPESAAEAVTNQANLIVSHHPLPFRPLKRLTGETSEGRLLLDLIAAGIAVYSPHTAFDSAEEGINQRLAAGL
jgi:dinuclear metal center YbgI/SA1388 family protein